MPEPKTIFYVSRLIYPKYHPIWLVIYMYFKYHSVAKRHIKYKLKVLSDGTLWNFIKNHPKSNRDINNCLLIHPDNIYPSDKVLRLCHEDSGTSRKLIIIPEINCDKDTLYISNTYFYNDFLMKTDFDLRLSKRGTNMEFAQEIDLSLVSIPCDISNSMVDQLIESYFKLPKLVCCKDVISVNVKYFCEALFYGKLNAIENVYFKINKVIFNNKAVDSEYFCLIGQTSIRLSPNVQSFVPRVILMPNKSKNFSEVTVWPNGLEEEFEQLENAVYPFLSNKNLRLKPIFLVQGEEGCGEDVLIKALAKSEGMHHFRVNNCDLSANVYAQNESKLKNVFFTAKMSAPCILSIHKFENFGKNSEGHYDPRLINSFINYLENFFNNNINQLPVIIFCCSNSKTIAPELKRVFLEIFEINAPTDTNRAKILQWILEKNCINHEKINLQLIANKTNGFYFEDLKALAYHADNNNLDFEKALEFMQKNYNESLGAPKVPKVQWTDVGGLQDVKNEIINTINLPLKHPELFENSGLTRSGILLFGPPGTGKTLLAKAVATECNLCFLTVKGPELLNMYVGQSEQNVREVFEKARQASPCIIFFDELDSLAPNRGLSGDSGGVMDRVVSQLLAEMDGLNGAGKVFVIGATNRPDLIDPALLRPGRFDKLLYVGPCTDLESKLSVLKALTRKFSLSERVNLREIVTNCPKNITGADFYGICSNAWSLAAKRLIESIEKEALDGENEVVVDVQDFAMAIKNVKLSISERDLEYFENLREELGSRKNC